MLWLGRAASAGAARPQDSDCLPTDHTVRIISRIQLAWIARSTSSSSLWSSAAPPGIFTISKMKKSMNTSFEITKQESKRIEL